MKVMFQKCHEAISFADTSGLFGCFYSTKHDANMNIHIHNCCEVLFCISGGKTFFINERIYDVNDGDIFILNQFENHKITSDLSKTFERYVLQINHDFLHKISSSVTDLSRCFFLRNENISHKISTTKEQRQTLTDLFEKLDEQNDFGDEIIKEMTATKILLMLNEMFLDSNKDYTYTVKYENQNLVKALNFINENYHKELTLEIIAKNIFISQNELCSIFKKHLGTTVKKYITSRRITKAKQLLKKGKTVSETAALCGFEDYSSFIRAFGRVTGMSPGKYKKTDIS